MTGIMRAQIDWLPLSMGGVRPTTGPYTGRDAGVWRIAELQPAVNQLRVLGAGCGWSPSQPVLRRQGFRRVRRRGPHERPSPYYNRIVDVMEGTDEVHAPCCATGTSLSDRPLFRTRETGEEVSER